MKKKYNQVRKMEVIKNKEMCESKGKVKQSKNRQKIEEKTRYNKI